MAPFYEENPEESLLLGDVVVGFQHITLQIDAPGTLDVSLKFTQPDYCIVMTPCCSVGNRTLALAPLQPLKASFFENPYFADDLTRINAKIPPQYAVKPSDWDSFSPERRQAELARGEAYTLIESFVYADHPLLAPYELRKRGGALTTGHYLLEFGSIFKVGCAGIARGKPAPSGIKRLQLSVRVRQQLREKLVHYFGRVPDEDARLL